MGYQRRVHGRAACGVLEDVFDDCADTLCPEVVCEDGSEPPIPEGGCCGDLSLCPCPSCCCPLNKMGHADPGPVSFLQLAMMPTIDNCEEECGGCLLNC